MKPATIAALALLGGLGLYAMTSEAKEEKEGDKGAKGAPATDADWVDDLPDDVADRMLRAYDKHVACDKARGVDDPEFQAGRLFAMVGESMRTGPRPKSPQEAAEIYETVISRYCELPQDKWEAFRDGGYDWDEAY